MAGVLRTENTSPYMFFFLRNDQFEILTERIQIVMYTHEAGLLELDGCVESNRQYFRFVSMDTVSQYGLNRDAIDDAPFHYTAFHAFCMIHGSGCQPG